MSSFYSGVILYYLITEYSSLHCPSSCWNSSSCGVDQSAQNCSQFSDTSLCHREGGLSYAVISLGTVWIGLALYNFRKRSVLLSIHISELLFGSWMAALSRKPNVQSLAKPMQSYFVVPENIHTPPTEDFLI